MRLKDRTEGGIAVVEVHGDLRGGPETKVFREHITDLLEQGNREILLNMGHCKWLNSEGVGMIIGVFTSVKNRSGDLKIGDYTERVHHIFETVGIWRVIELYRSELDALDSFESGSNEKAFGLPAPKAMKEKA